MEDKETINIEETERSSILKDLQNRCAACGMKAGSWKNKETGVIVKVFLINDSRQVKICNNCAKEGKLIKKHKLTKAEKKKFKKLKREIKMVKDIPHITLNAKGEVVK
jgi:hypothetical protein